jgi:lipopolysaccharide heptosyltransferase I
VRRLLVVRLGSLGDLIHTLPAVAALRRAFPALEIDWLVEPPHRPLLDLVPVLSSVIVLPARTARGWLEARRMLRAREYDVAADFQGLIKSAALARLSGAARVVGFARPALREPAAASFYTQAIEVGEGRHVIDKNLRLAAALGAAPGPLEFPLAAVESAALDDVRARLAPVFALINPGAAWPNKRWPPERFGAVAAHVRRRHGLSSVVLWGPGERDAAEAAAAASEGAATVAPETALPDLLALSRAARLMVSGDTGPLHIAAACGVPVVSLFGPTNPARNGPWSPADVAITRYDGCPCHYQRRCRQPGHWCLETISTAEVTAAIDRRLSTPAPGGG